MPITPASVLDRASGGRGTQLLRYAGVSVVGVGVHQAVLVGLYLAADVRGFVANAVAASIASVPAFVLNKRWAWGHDSRADWRREVLPFWLFSVAGLILSTVLVYAVDHYTDRAVYVSAASLAGYGLLWTAKFAFLDSVMFHEHRHDLDPV